jgi:hypothetical protein
VSALAIVAKDSKSLTPARSMLANLLYQADQLRREVEPLAEQMRRCDEVQDIADKAQRHRDALLEEFDRAIAEAIVMRRERPDSTLLDDAELELRRAQADARAIVRERDRLNVAMAALNERNAGLQREIAAVTANVLVDTAVAIADTEFRLAYRNMRRFEELIDGIHARLVQTGQAAEALDRQLRIIRTEISADRAPNIAAVQRFIARLAADLAAELEPDGLFRPEWIDRMAVNDFEPLDL